MANKEACNVLANYIEASEEPFVYLNMNDCIWGFAKRCWPPSTMYGASDEITRRLEIKQETLVQLCAQAPGARNIAKVTRAMAVGALRRLGETGEVRFDDGDV
jgi:hypothetical protein